MKFITVVAAIFCGKAMLVDADYYIEFTVPTLGRASSSRPRSRATTVTNLYECKGYPEGITALEAKKTIYATHTFYIVHRTVDLQGHQIRLLDGNSLAHNNWMLGYSNDEIDHPRFADPTQADINLFRSRVEDLGVDTVVPHYLVDGLSFYFAQTNLISLSLDLVTANSRFLSFTNFLSRVMERYEDYQQEFHPGAHNMTEVQLDGAMKMGLEKMIDPCSILVDNLQNFASGYCATYCNFLQMAAQRLGTTSNSCSSLQGGYCADFTCMCVRRVTNPFAGCSNPAMHKCNNAVRASQN